MARQDQGKLDFIEVQRRPVRNTRAYTYFPRNERTQIVAVDRSDTEAAQAQSDGAQTTADGKNKVSYGAAPHSSAATGDLWFNGDTTTNCPDNNCTGHTLDGSGVPNVGAFPHRKTNWVHRYSGTAWLDALGIQSVAKSDIVDASVISAKLDTASVIAAKIADGAVTALKIAASSITARQMVLADFINLCGNANGDDYNVGTGAADGWISNLSVDKSVFDASLPTGARGISQTVRDNYFGQPFECNPGDQFFVSSDHYTVGCNFATTVGLYFSTDGGGGFINWIAGGTATANTAGKQSISGTITAPAGSRYARVWAQIDGSSGFGTNYFRNVFVRRKAAADLIVDGAITTAKLDALAVTAAKVAAGAIETDKLAANAVTAAKIAANTITAAEIAANAVTASEIDAAAVTASKIHADALATSDFTEVADTPTGGVKLLSANSVPNIWAKDLTFSILEKRKNGTNVYLCSQAGAGLTTSEFSAAAWSSATTYALNDLVTYSGRAYKSLQASNLNHQPDISPTWWQDRGSLTGPSGTGTGIVDGSAIWNYYQQLRIGPGGAKVGSYELSAPVVASLTALARSGITVSDVVWYRGNNNANKNGGAPILIDPVWTRSTVYAVGDRVTGDPVTAGTYPLNTNRDGSAGAAQRVYKCITAGTSASTGAGPTGTGADITDNTVHWAHVNAIATEERLSLISYRVVLAAGTQAVFPFRVSLQARDNNDNFDGMKHLRAVFFDTNKNNLTGGELNEWYVILTDRGYYQPSTPTHTNHVITASFMWPYLTGIVTNNTFDGYVRITVFNAFGPSTDRDIDLSTAAGYPQTGIAGGWTLGGAAGGAGGGGGGGGECPAPEIGVLMADGHYRPAGLLRPGDRIWTIPGGPSDAKEPGVYEVTGITVHDAPERLALVLEGGTRLVYSPKHLVMTPSGWNSVRNLRSGDKVLTLRGEAVVASVLPAAAGKVVRITTSASTYVTEGGVLNHNLKAQ